MTTPKSSYPMPVDELLPKARELAGRLGHVPSRNRLMTELKVGAPKARAIRDELESGNGQPEEDEAETQPLPTANPVPEPAETPVSDPASEATSGQTTVDADPAPSPGAASDVETARPPKAWPVLLLALPAFVSIWSGWVGLGGLTGFGIVHPLPGIADRVALNTAITLPIGVETYAAYALRVWLSGQVPQRARRFAKFSALGSLVLGALGQVAYHLMSAAGVTTAPWWITTLVACLPVAVLGMGASLTHLLRTDDRREVSQ